MPGLESVIQRAFTAGELSPALGARADQIKYIQGLRTCKNFIVQRHGGVQNRPGTRYVATAKFTTATRLIPFVFEADDQTYIIEVGAGYFRWVYHGSPVVVSGVSAWSNATSYVVGDLVVQGGVNYYCIIAHTNQQPPNATYWHPLTGTTYEVPNPYLAADIPGLKWSQSADVLTLTHPLHAPRDLNRVGHTTWTLVTIVTVPSITAPLNLAGAVGTAGSETRAYVVTAAKDDSYEESYASVKVTLASGAPPTIAAPNTLSWDVHADAIEYYVHEDPYGNGIFGFIGTAKSNSFNDVGFTPDFTVTPSEPRVLFAATGDYPRASAYYQQRLLFANSNNDPEQVWMSKTGAFRNFSISTPLQDDDAVTFVLASLNLNPVSWLLPLTRLMVLTDAGEWLVEGDDTGAITPTAINAHQQGYVGAIELLRPILIENSLVYVRARGNRLRDLRFETGVGGLQGGDLTIFAEHLFKGFSLIAMAFQQEPNSVIWICRSDGVLLGCTYLREHEVLGWHRHTTGASGLFEDVAVIPDTSIQEDVPYFVVRRTIDGSTVLYIERFASRQVTDLDTDAFFMDSGLTYSGVPSYVFTGLEHLEGEVVAILADGKVVFDGDPDADNSGQFRVVNGEVRLPHTAEEIHVGIPIRFAEIETLDLDIEGTSVRDKRKRVGKLSALVEASGQLFLAGPDADHLLRMRPEPWQVDDILGALKTGILDISLTSSFTNDGRVIIRHTDPLPLTVLGVLPALELGG